MNKSFTLLLTLIVLVSCSENEDPVRRISPEMAPYIETFYNEANERSVSIPQTIIAELGNTQSVTEIQKEGDQYILRFDQELFTTLTESQIEAHTFFALGKLILHREHNDNGYSFMNSDLWAGYDQADKESLFDELFTK